MITKLFEKPYVEYDSDTNDYAVRTILGISCNSTDVILSFSLNTEYIDIYSELDNIGDLIANFGRSFIKQIFANDAESQTTTERFIHALNGSFKQVPDCINYICSSSKTKPSNWDIEINKTSADKLKQYIENKGEDIDYDN